MRMTGNCYDASAMPCSRARWRYTEPPPIAANLRRHLNIADGKSRQLPQPYPQPCLHRDSNYISDEGIRANSKDLFRGCHAPTPIIVPPSRQRARFQM